MKEANTEPLSTSNEVEEKRVLGKIIKIHPDGFGFVSTREIPFTKIFFHWTSLENNINFLELKFGTKVSFIAQKLPDKGWRAIKIKLEEG